MKNNIIFQKNLDHFNMKKPVCFFNDPSEYQFYVMADWL